MKKIILTFLIAFVCFFGINKVYAAEYRVDYSSSIQWVFVGANGDNGVKSLNWGSATDLGEKSFGQTYTIPGSNCSVHGDCFYSGPRMLLVRLYDLDLKSNTYYRMVIRLIHDNAMGVWQSNINENNECAIYSSGTWQSFCPSNSASITNTKEITIYFQTLGSGSILSYQIGNPYASDNNQMWSSYQNHLSQSMSFGVQSVELWESDDTSAQLNEMVRQQSDTNNKLNDLKDKQSETNSKLEESNKKLDEQNKKLQETNDTLKDDDVSESSEEAESFFSGFTTDTYGLTSIITAPLELIGNLSGSTCSPLSLEFPFVKNTTLELPCMSSIYKKYFGSFLTVYQTITFGIVSYWVCVRIFALVKDFKNPDNDEIEVMDL